MSVDIRILSEHNIDQFIELIRVFEEVFEMDKLSIAPEEYLRNLLSQEHFMAIVALETQENTVALEVQENTVALETQENTQQKVVAGLTAYILPQYYCTKPLAYVYDLAVLSSYQRRGIGTALMSEIRNYATIHNFEEVFVQADLGDDAVEFYHSTQPSNVEDVLHFYYTITPTH